MRSRILAPVKTLLNNALRSRIVLTSVVVLLAAWTVYVTSNIEDPTVQAAAAQGAKRVDVPDLVGGTDWLNTDKPISLADLKGRIVLLDFWTLCCINCIHTLPDLAMIEARYPGIVVVIGVHTPKFDNEKKTASIMKAILRYEIKHPVINDADKKIWNAYGCNHWPTLVLIDPDGKFRGAAKGEGHLNLADRSIKELIKEFEAKGTLKKTPITFKLAHEKATSPLNFPGKVLVDAKSKRTFIADSTNHRIVITNLEGEKIAVAGTGREGLKDGAFADAQFSDPQGLAFDSNGETLYVADRKNHSIRALNLKNETVKLVAGTGAKSLIFGKPGAGAPARKLAMASPWDLHWHNKRLYIAIAGHNQIWTFDPAKDTLAIYAGNGMEDLIDGPVRTAAFAQPSGLASDGARLYFGEYVADHGVLAQVSTGGGEVAFIPTPFQNAWLEDISPDHTQLLVRNTEGIVTAPGTLWAVPTLGRSPRRLGNITTTSAAWSPDGKTIVYAIGRDLFIANSDGTDPRKLVTLPGDATLQAVMYGPLVLAGRLGTEGLDAATLRAGPTRPRTVPEYTGAALSVPVIAAPSPEPQSWLARAGGRPLEFRTVGQARELTLAPLNSIFDERYAVYWRVDTARGQQTAG